MGYQIGCHGVLGFHDMLAALARGDTEAADQGRTRLRLGRGDPATREACR